MQRALSGRAADIQLTLTGLPVVASFPKYFTSLHSYITMASWPNDPESKVTEGHEHSYDTHIAGGEAHRLYMHSFRPTCRSISGGHSLCRKWGPRTRPRRPGRERESRRGAMTICGPWRSVRGKESVDDCCAQRGCSVNAWKDAAFLRGTACPI